MVVRVGTDNRLYLSYLLNVYSSDNFYLTAEPVGAFPIEILQLNINTEIKGDSIIENE